MDSLEAPKFTVCKQCNQSIINYPNQLCRKQFLTPQPRSITHINKFKRSGNSELDEFIKETQLNSKHCDDFIEWIPRKNVKNIEFLADGGNSKVYSGTWNLLLNM